MTIVLTGFPDEKTAITVVSVSSAPGHGFIKLFRDSIQLRQGLGVAGDAHMGHKVKHRSRVARDPTQPNLRQVHVIHAELLDELAAAGFDVAPGVLGENITTRGLDVLALPRGTLLHFGADAVVEVTGLRNPCNQLNAYQPGLTAAVLDRSPDGALIRKAGIMGIVTTTGDVRLGDGIRISLPARPHLPLEPV